MFISKYVLTPIAILIVATTVVLAQDDQRRMGPAPSFSDLDSSADGVLSRDEFDAWVTAASERRAQRGDSDEGRPAPTGSGGGGRGGAEFFSRIDSNADGEVSEAEFTAMVDGIRGRQGMGQGRQPRSDATDNG